uniref:Mediator of RNA polymerase II transcription subunit 8 n=2 Tax=Photinus pyralis TaxID=7054 RepID=A0A1Y1KP43_PHOPY
MKMQQAREEKQLESALDSIIQRINDLKASVASMIFKVENEYETLNWPTFLDNYALLSGHLTSLSKLMNHDKCPPLRNLTVLPLMLSPERDEQLVQGTEGRVITFAHDLVPDYLRTKLEPLAENKMLQLEHKATNLTYDNAQVLHFTFICTPTQLWPLEASNSISKSCLSRMGYRK